MNEFVALMYHNVCASQAVDGRFQSFDDLSSSVTSYFIDVKRFSSHCAAIARSGRALTVDEVTGTLDDDRSTDVLKDEPPAQRGGRAAALLTCDDGWRGTVEVGGPVLEAYNLQALLFVTTDLIGHPYFVDRALLQRLPRSFVVGSHAKSHRLLPELTENQIRSELVESKAVLEDILGREVVAVAFPGGAYDRRVLRIAWEAGYRGAFTSRPSVNRVSRKRRPIGRLAVKSGTTVETVSRWLDGGIRRERLKSAGLEGGKRLLGRTLYRTLRSRLLSENATQLDMTDLAAASSKGEMLS